MKTKNQNKPKKFVSEKRNKFLMENARMIADIREKFEDYMTKEQKEELDTFMEKARKMSNSDFGFEVGMFIIELEKTSGRKV